MHKENIAHCILGRAVKQHTTPKRWTAPNFTAVANVSDSWRASVVCGDQHASVDPNKD
jgi:hypothetical protein